MATKLDDLLDKYACDERYVSHRELHYIARHAKAEIDRLTRDLDAAQLQAEHHRVMSLARQDEVERLRGILASIGRAADDVLNHRREGTGKINLHVEWVSEQCQKAGGNDE